MNENEQRYYETYVIARSVAWATYDALVENGFNNAEIDDHPVYQVAIQQERQAFQRWLKERDA